MMESAVPPQVLAAFEGEPHLTMPALARVLKMDRKTLDGHRKAENLPVHIKGTGLARRHYVCTLADVAEFYRKTLKDRPAPPIEPPAIKIPRAPRKRARFKSGQAPGNRARGFIYFVTDGEFIKIGWSKDWKKRVAILQIANPRPLTVLGVCAGTILQENRLHLQFERHRNSGEWHSSHPEILDHIAGIVRVDSEASP